MEPSGDAPAVFLARQRLRLLPRTTTPPVFRGRTMPFWEPSTRKTTQNRRNARIFAPVLRFCTRRVYDPPLQSTGLTAQICGRVRGAPLRQSRMPFIMAGKSVWFCGSLSESGHGLQQIPCHKTMWAIVRQVADIRDFPLFCAFSAKCTLRKFPKYGIIYSQRRRENSDGKAGKSYARAL